MRVLFLNTGNARRSQKEHWPLPDPAKAIGSAADIEAVFRESSEDPRRRAADLMGAWGQGKIDE